MAETEALFKDFIYTDKNGKEHEIYPMVLKDQVKVNRLYSKINTEYLFLNLPTPKLNRKGEPVIDKKTKEPIMDTSSYDAMMTIFSMALQETKEEIEEWVDLHNGVEILDEYLCVSGLKI